MKRLQDLCEPKEGDHASPRRGFAAQAEQRRREHALRCDVATFAKQIFDQGMALPAIAARLDIVPRTVRQWFAEFEAARRSPHFTIHIAPLGRPIIRSPRVERSAVLAVLDEVGPAIGVPTLHDCFPFMPRAELADLLTRYGCWWRRKNIHAPHALDWLVAGFVWAMDFSQAPCRIDGRQRDLLAVRDLASGKTLHWSSVENCNSDAAIAALATLATLAALASLFAEHGAPLVPKTDNGSPFGAASTQEFLEQSGVANLFSPPPHTPTYNGAIEAGIGSLKTRTEPFAQARGTPGQWSAADLAAAALEADCTARPRGNFDPSPHELWSEPMPIGPMQRFFFRAVAEEHAVQARRETGLPDDLTLSQERLIQRHALRRALVELGYLSPSRRRLNFYPAHASGPKGFSDHAVDRFAFDTPIETYFEGITLSCGSNGAGQFYNLAGSAMGLYCNTHEIGKLIAIFTEFVSATEGADYVQKAAHSGFLYLNCFVLCVGRDTVTSITARRAMR